VFAKTSYQRFILPQLISVKGISESSWERKRPVWEGDCDRERVPRKKQKINRDADAEGNESIDGTENGMAIGE
jgi:hypothetical protein